MEKETWFTRQARGKNNLSIMKKMSKRLSLFNIYTNYSTRINVVTKLSERGFILRISLDINIT